ncbi:MAG: CocE/NonD family hydrolase [Thermoleophilaceae bacterium]
MQGIVTRIASAAAVIAMLALAPAATAAPNTYIEMQDGTRLAANLQLPPGDPPAGGWPAIFVYDGYAGGSSPVGGPDSIEARYATIHVSIRGTGCSGGRFDLFDRRHAKDGYEIVEWIADQPWSNGRVGLMGHSYGGITATFTAAEDPPHLDALVVSGLIDDLYRGIVYPGGVPNLGFPLAWPYAYRPAVDVSGGTLPGLAEGDMECVANLADREAPNVMDEPLLNGIIGYNDGPWWAAHSLYTYLDGIDVPTFVGHAWQDEQTGPRGGPVVFEKLPEGLPKRFVASNGDHSVNGGAPPEVRAQRYAWIERFVRDVPNGIDAQPPVQVLLETAERSGALTSNGLVEGADFPFPGTDWTRWYLRSDEGLSTEPPAAGEGSDSYVAGTGRQSWNYFAPTVGGELSSAGGPDELSFRSEPMEQPTTIAGPIAATLHASTTALSVNLPVHTLSTDFFVTVADQAPDGTLTYLQRGMLRASFKALDELRTKRNADGEIIRPEHPFTHPGTVTPGEVAQYEIEVFPVAHVFRPGHRILVKVYSPPLTESLYVYVPSRLPALNTIVHDAEHPSSLLLPVVATPALGDPPGCGDLIGMRCVQPAG